MIIIWWFFHNLHVFDDHDHEKGNTSVFDWPHAHDNPDDLDDLDNHGDPGDRDGKGGLSERHPCVWRTPRQRHFVISLNQVSIPYHMFLKQVQICSSLRNFMNKSCPNPFFVTSTYIILKSVHNRFEVTVLPDYNIEEKETLKIFIKVPPFEVLNISNNSHNNTNVSSSLVLLNL